MASKDKPIVKPTYQSIREKIGTIPTRMTTRFAEEAKNEMNRIKSGKASSYETENIGKSVSDKAREAANNAMEKGKAALNNSMINDLNKVQANASSRLRDVGAQLKMEEIAKKKK